MKSLFEKMRAAIRSREDELSNNVDGKRSIVEGIWEATWGDRPFGVDESRIDYQDTEYAGSDDPSETPAPRTPR